MHLADDLVDDPLIALEVGDLREAGGRPPAAAVTGWPSSTVPTGTGPRPGTFTCTVRTRCSSMPSTIPDAVSTLIVGVSGVECRSTRRPAPAAPGPDPDRQPAAVQVGDLLGRQRGRQARSGGVDGGADRQCR